MAVPDVTQFGHQLASHHGVKLEHGDAHLAAGKKLAVGQP
jgi:hypothetical protein